MLDHRMITVYIIFILSLTPAPGISDTLVIPDISTQPRSAPDSTPRPARAMTMDQVKEQFGSPNQVMGPVGNPPITRWIYDSFVVTFESEYVIHSVAKRNP
jgi:hypothetical protein